MRDLVGDKLSFGSDNKDSCLSDRWILGKSSLFFLLGLGELAIWKLNNIFGWLLILLLVDWELEFNGLIGIISLDRGLEDFSILLNEG